MKISSNRFNLLYIKYEKYEYFGVKKKRNVSSARKTISLASSIITVAKFARVAERAAFAILITGSITSTF